MSANLWSYLACALLMLGTCRAVDDAIHPHHNYTLRWHRNVVIGNGLSDGERVRHVYYNGLVAKETSAIIEDKAGALLWQLSDGRRFIQVIYDAFHNMQDCEYLGPSTYVNKFLREWDREVHAMVNNQTGLDYEIEPIRKKKVGAKLRKQLDFKTLKDQCKKQHQEMRRLIEAQQHGDPTQQKEAASQLDRVRRSIEDVLRVPHTQWCGKGNRASKYEDLGGFAPVDRCCRQHDLHCPYHIPSLDQRYGLSNSRIYTMMHCACDERFRSCLKTADSSSANLVGNLFFNIIQTKCFVLKAERVCTKRSWWGKCEQHELRKQAYMRDPMAY